MGQQARLLCHQTPEIVVDLIGIERRQPEPLKVWHQREEPPRELAEPRLSWQIGAETRDVDAGQYDLAVAALDEMARLRDDVADRHGTVVAASQGDDAEGTAVVAALLHLEEGAGAAFEAVDEMGRRLPDREDVLNEKARRGTVAFAPEFLLV